MAKSTLKVRLFPRAEATVRAGHPWVFSDSVKSTNRSGEAGELAVVYDRQDRFLAVGFWDPDSPIPLRIAHRGEPVRLDRSWWLSRAAECRARREVLFSGETNGYRCINGDSEGFPGLVVDRYGDTLVVKLYSAAWISRWDEMEGVLREVFQPTFLIRRVARNLSGIEEGFVGETGPEVVVFQEMGLHFEAAVRHGQKTGFFLDQRENRARVGELAKGRDVLNMFSFSGGFSVHAARGGASRVTDVDISAHALESADRNFALNPELSSVPRTGVQADAFRWMGETQERWDLIVTDPPSLAKRERDKAGALKAYRALNAQAIRCLKPGGVLVAASCSAHVRAGEFLGMIREEVRRSGRESRELWSAGHAPDHPAAFAEAHYLKAVAMELG
ncbi:23S rRNA (cytosine1962-C5)-methyltransferase [Haloferula luteola]|uniref:23S rRNA (Cytosine1962-C5)-methyltransferase n=1 Tax=Haloferula luteola TaxID=595692 RepID=A0A840VB63_9BACT|nr:class I SAM-dependent rRNA methyltransferase [Haloferula luteola]MBB5350131.1 23S rRNA (cytosine1962-C5)-methyltransferase [Haloferula luteola]